MWVSKSWMKNELKPRIACRSSWGQVGRSPFQPGEFRSYKCKFGSRLWSSRYPHLSQIRRTGFPRASSLGLWSVGRRIFIKLRMRSFLSLLIVLKGQMCRELILAGNHQGQSQLRESPLFVLKKKATEVSRALWEFHSLLWPFRNNLATERCVLFLRHIRKTFQVPAGRKEARRRRRSYTTRPGLL